MKYDDIVKKEESLKQEHDKHQMAFMNAKEVLKDKIALLDSI